MSLTEEDRALINKFFPGITAAFDRFGYFYGTVYQGKFSALLSAAREQSRQPQGAASLTNQQQMLIDRLRVKAAYTDFAFNNTSLGELYRDAADALAALYQPAGREEAANEHVPEFGPLPRAKEIRIESGQVLRFIEREIEGDKWEILGSLVPADTQVELDRLQSRVAALEKALEVLIRHFEGDEDHDEGAFDETCADCIALADARAVLTTQEETKP